MKLYFIGGNIKCLDIKVNGKTCLNCKTLRNNWEMKFNWIDWNSSEFYSNENMRHEDHWDPKYLGS